MKGYQIALLFSVLVLGANTIKAQSNNDPIGVREELVKILKKNARFPIELSQKKVSAVFSLKITLSANNEVAKISASKFFPQQMIPQLTNPVLFKGINWEAIFNRRIKDGDVVIIPFVAYNSLENNATFYEYTMEDLFAFPGDLEPFIHCVIMQTYVLAYREAVH